MTTEGTPGRGDSKAEGPAAERGIDPWGHWLLGMQKLTSLLSVCLSLRSSVLSYWAICFPTFCWVERVEL